MSKKQKRYGSEKSINDAINGIHARIQELVAEAEMLDKTGHEFIKHDETVEDGKMKLSQAQTIRDSSIPRQEAKLNKFKEALAEFRTETFDFVGSDPSVVLH